MSGEWPCNSWPATIELVELAPWRWRGGAGLHSHHRPLSSTFEHKCCWPKIQIFRPLVSPPAAGDPRWSTKRPGSSGGYRGALLPQSSPSHEWQSSCRSRPSRLFVEKKKEEKTSSQHWHHPTNAFIFSKQGTGNGYHLIRTSGGAEWILSI